MGVGGLRGEGWEGGRYRGERELGRKVQSACTGPACVSAGLGSDRLTVTLRTGACPGSQSLGFPSRLSSPDRLQAYRSGDPVRLSGPWGEGCRAASGPSAP